jgi:tetratricopeptide (TPR) repeat protein
MRAVAVGAVLALLWALPAGATAQERESGGLLGRARALVEADSLDAARALVEAVRADAPDAPVVDELVALLAAALLGRGEPEAAALVLEGATGPASSVRLGHLLLARGDVTAGIQVLLGAVPELEPSRASDVLQLVALVGRLPPEAAPLLARAGALAAVGRGGEAARVLEGAVPHGAPEVGAPFLAQGARWAEEAGEVDGAIRLRERLLAEYPDAPEAEEGALSLARALGSATAGRGRAVALLEALLERAPGSAVAPDARRELERLRGGA